MDATVKFLGDAVPYCVCGQIIVDTESVRPSYLYHWIANRMLFPVYIKLFFFNSYLF